jgi:hypothetical protein
MTDTATLSDVIGVLDDFDDRRDRRFAIGSAALDLGP